MERRIKDPDAELLAYLENMNERLRDLVEFDFVRNPDDFAEHLEIDAGVVQESVGSLMSELKRVPRSVDLNEIVDQACREFLTTASSIVITTKKDPVLPGLPHSYELLIAAVMRALQLTAKHSGTGGELFVSTTTDGLHDVVEIRSPHPESPERALEERVMALSDLVKDTGGNGFVSVAVDPSGAIVRMSLSFETRVTST